MSTIPAVAPQASAPDSKYTYWATEQNPESLASHCIERARRFKSFMQGSRYWTQAFRSWRYYHGLYFDGATNSGSMAITAIGREAEQVGLGVNHMRNLIQHQVGLVTQNRPAYKTRARTADQKGLKSSELGDTILQHYLDERDLEANIITAVEQAYVIFTGYIYAPWNPKLGQPIASVKNDDGTTITLRNGDMEFHNPTIFDVVFDTRVHNQFESPWALLRTWENKWDLASELTGRDRARVLDYHAKDSDMLVSFANTRTGYDDVTDMVPVWNFYHRDSDGCPGGRFFRFLGDDIALGPAGKNPYGERLPLFGMQPWRVMLTPFGSSPSVDIQPLQEMMNAEYSAVATNHTTCSVQHIFAPRDSEYDESLLKNGVVLIKGTSEAKGINLTYTPPEVFKFIDKMEQTAELFSGVNATVRGQPEPSLESGEALKVMDARAVQFATPARRSFYRMFEQLGTHILRTIREQMDGDEERLVTIAGEDERPFFSTFTRKDIYEIDRVVVDVGNPLTNTQSGKMAMARDLMEMGLVKTAEEYQTVMNTGNLKPLVKGDKAQLDLIHDENEKLRAGIEVAASMIDNHALHVKEHSTLINSVETRFDNEFSAGVLAHVMEHITFLMSPQTQMLMLTLGYQVPIPPNPMAQQPPEQFQRQQSVTTMAPQRQSPGQGMEAAETRPGEGQPRFEDVGVE